MVNSSRFVQTEVVSRMHHPSRSDYISVPQQKPEGFKKFLEVMVKSEMAFTRTRVMLKYLDIDMTSSP